MLSTHRFLGPRWLVLRPTVCSPWLASIVPEHERVHPVNRKSAGLGLPLLRPHHYLSGLSRPVVYFVRQVLGLPVVSKEELSQRTHDYQDWVEAYARNHNLPHSS